MPDVSEMAYSIQDIHVRGEQDREVDDIDIRAGQRSQIAKNDCIIDCLLPQRWNWRKKLA
jgi:hypothetical protein